MDDRQSRDILIVAPLENDATVAAQVLTDSGVSAIPCSNVDELCRRIHEGCGAAVISEDALSPSAIEALQNVLRNQEPWSDLPIILLTQADVVRATEIFSGAGNISLIERPFSRLTLIRSVAVALRSRAKQYEVRDLLLELRKSKEEAVNANQAKTHFLANMSHEIRTPLGAIIGFLDLIKSSPESPDNQVYTNVIERNSQQLLSLIDDILDLSKVEAGKMTIEYLGIRLSDFLRDFVSTMNLRAAEKGLKFDIRYETPMPEEIVSDPVRLRQVLLNITSNAIKFTERGFVQLILAFREGCLRFAVTDSGVGLSESQIANLFKPFSQADMSTTRKFGGTGLGLVLSRHLAEALGGTLVLEKSAPGEGSTFVAEIPARVPSRTAMLEHPGSRASSGEAGPGDAHLLSGLKVLLVEDSSDNQVLIAKFLRKNGAEIEIKSNGAEGVEEAVSSTYDLVLMDVQMPVMDGHEATRRLRALHYNKPIIALTARAMAEEQRKCFESGFTDFLTKPIHQNLLTNVLAKYVPKNTSLH